MDTELKRLLRREASLHHMCEENRTSLEYVDTKEDAIALYKKTIDWALRENYPNIDVLRKYFSDCESEGIFVDKEFHGEVLDKQKVYVFHNCKGVIRTGLNISDRIIPMLYFANGCDMRVESSGATVEACMTVRVPLYIFGDSNVTWEKTEDLICKPYKCAVK